MEIEDRISAFVTLGKYLMESVSLQNGDFISQPTEGSMFSNIENAVMQAQLENPWFTRDNILIALKNISASLERPKIEHFMQPYADRLTDQKTPQTIGVVMAGNIPAVGFHDFLCVLLAGRRFLGKLSSEDFLLLPAIAELLVRIKPEFGELIAFTDKRLHDFDSVIATGGNNSHRYFEYYFDKYPHILRKNRNGVAILTGRETSEELSGLADDIFMFFGKGCRSIAKLFLPEGYDFQLLHEPFTRYNHLFNHHKYRNNYDYYKTIFIIDKIPFIDFGNLLLVESMDTASPVSVLNFEYYNDVVNVKNILQGMNEQIQCIVCHNEMISPSIKPGKAQSPELWDYADGVDTMEFLLNL